MQPNPDFHSDLFISSFFFLMLQTLNYHFGHLRVKGLTQQWQQSGNGILTDDEY